MGQDVMPQVGQQGRHLGVLTTPELLQWANSSPKAVDWLETTHHSTVPVGDNASEFPVDREGENSARTILINSPVEIVRGIPAPINPRSLCRSGELPEVGKLPQVLEGQPAQKSTALAFPQQKVMSPVVLPLSGVTIYPGNRTLVRVSFRVTFVEGHKFMISFSVPLITGLSLMTTQEARWITEHTPWRLVEQFRHGTVLSVRIYLS